MPKSIDVIVPIYNGEKYLETLIKSFKHQTYQDFRIIFVNDGSTDNSHTKLQNELVDVSFSYTVFSQENKGLPSARNVGLYIADAEWVVFVDCDDVLDKHYLEYMHLAVSKSFSNVGICQHKQIKESDIELSWNTAPLEYSVVKAEELMREYYIEQLISPCTMIIKLDWLKKNNLYFDENCTYLEDGPFVTSVIAYAVEISRIKNKLYLYIHRGNSLIKAEDSAKYVVAHDGFLRLENRLQDVDNEAVKVFRKVAHIRYLLIILRRAARQLSYHQFRELATQLPINEYYHQAKHQRFTRRVAASALFVSKTIFYYGIRLFSA